MPIKKVSLETAKLLKDAGFKHNTACAYTESGVKEIIEKWDCISIPFYPAPTTDELLEELPWRINVLNTPCDLMITKGPKKFSVRYVASYDFPKRGNNTPTVNESLPEAIAQTWLYLNVKGLLNAKR